MEFDARAIAVLNKLKSFNHEAFLVGGCVRDFLRNVAPHDYDITTSALPEETLNLFSDVKTVTTGLQHGTVTVLWDGLSVEVTTYRVDGAYTDGRRPDGVCFTQSLTEDLARRDFTVNAMAWAPDAGIVDPFDGQNDLSAGILRCVEDPSERFREDGLRILRALRFSATMGFPLESQTKSALRNLKDNLLSVSAERILEEFTKLLCGAHAGDVLLEFPDVIGVFLPELLPTVGFDQKNFHHLYPLYTHLIHAVEQVAPTPHLRWAALLHDVGKPDCFSLDEAGVGHFFGHAKRSAEAADGILQRLRASNDLRERVVNLIRHHDAPIDLTPAAVRRKLNKLGESGFFDLISLMRADNLALAPEFHFRQDSYGPLESLAREILSEKQCFSLRDLAVKGNDLIKLGYEGKEIGEKLQFLLDAVLDGTAPNEKSALLSLLNKK